MRNKSTNKQTKTIILYYCNSFYLKFHAAWVLRVLNFTDIVCCIWRICLNKTAHIFNGIRCLYIWLQIANKWVYNAIGQNPSYIFFICFFLHSTIGCLQNVWYLLFSMYKYLSNASGICRLIFEIYNPLHCLHCGVFRHFQN